MNSATLKILGLFLVFALILGGSVFGLLDSSRKSGGVSEEQVKEIIKDYISDNPSIVIEAITAYQQQVENDRRQASQSSIKDHLDDLESDDDDPIFGNPNASVTVVEFFDYNCGYCKKVFPVIAKLVANDNDVKVVFKELPILSQGSIEAAKAALAVHISSPEKYVDYHAELMKIRIGSKGDALKVAESMGLDRNKIESLMEGDEVKEIIKDNTELAAKIGVRGTPAFTINGEFVGGFVDYDTLKGLVDSKR